MGHKSKVHTLLKRTRHRAPHLSVTHRKSLKSTKATNTKELLTVRAPIVGSSKGHSI